MVNATTETVDPSVVNVSVFRGAYFANDTPTRFNEMACISLDLVQSTSCGSQSGRLTILNPTKVVASP